MKYKVGDKVKIKSKNFAPRSGIWNWEPYQASMLIGLTGTIEEVCPYYYKVHSIDNEEPTDGAYLGLYDDDDLELCEEEKCSFWAISESVPEFWKEYSQSNNNFMKTLKNGVLELTKQVKNTLGRISPEYRDLYRAGYLNGDLEETSKYDAKLQELLREKHREEISEIAKKEIEEAEEEEKIK